MSRRNKLQKFADLQQFPNFYENFHHDKPQLLGMNAQPVSLAGRWASSHFGNDHPVTLELACGRGEYTVQLAERFPERNFIGVDVKGARIWKGAKYALEQGLHNAAFLRTRIEQLTHFFTSGEVAEIWITFPDPFLKAGKENRRLTSPRFLDAYRRIMPAGGMVHLKTDSPDLFEFTLEVLDTYPHATLDWVQDDIYSQPLVMEELAFKTYYENSHLREGKTIKYVRIKLD
ncbi:MAG: tRNA (guanosine(46)-N7)-methyltransferase TrmB [Saprospiraceae bacterium]